MSLSDDGPVLVTIVKRERDQIVPLPEGFRFDGIKEVSIRRDGNRVVLEPVTEEPSSRISA